MPFSKNNIVALERALQRLASREDDVQIIISSKPPYGIPDDLLRELVTAIDGAAPPPENEIFRIDVSAMGEGTEVVSVVETGGSMKFAIALNVTETTPERWGPILADLVRDMGKVMADRGVHQHGVDLSFDDVVRMMVSTMMGEFAASTAHSPIVLGRGRTD
jgi:hypothetical protein